MFEPAEIAYTNEKGVDRVFKTTERMVPFQESILAGQTYPRLSVMANPRVILDIGGNHGAAALYFADAYPDASIYSFEPSEKNYKFLIENVESLYPQIQAENIGVLNLASDQPLYEGVNNEGEASICGSMEQPHEDASFEPLQNMLDEDVLAKVDIVKIDVEGAEVDVLQNVLFNCTPKVIYLEYSSTNARVAVEHLLQYSYKLVVCRCLSLDTGEMIYYHA